MMQFATTKEFALSQDAQDPLQQYRSEFHIPKVNNKPALYFTGNSLGLQPKNAMHFVQEIMQDWQDLGVEGHFYADKPWWDYHERLKAPLARIVGALPQEVTVMNTLTVNLHLLMVSFFKPTKTRYTIICEEKAFPSDKYMLDSQLAFHGLDPKTCLIEIKKPKDSHTWQTDTILQAIEQAGDSLALVLLGGVNYYNGQVLPMQQITQKAHAVGAKVGFDLAHAAGNIPLQLHDWGVDFAAWCSYKYLNSGPGNLSGIFVHQKHLNAKDITRFQGWWGARKETRFLMQPDFDPSPDADAWQLSNPPVLAMAPFLASLSIFDRVGMPALYQKQKKLTAYLEYLILDVAKCLDADFEIITPKDPEQRGCQLSVLLHGYSKTLFTKLLEQGVIADWREPNVIRLAPVPLYTSYLDVYYFSQILKQQIIALQA